MSAGASGAAGTPPADGAAPLSDIGLTVLPTIAPPKQNWVRWLGQGMTVVMLIVTVLQLRDISWDDVRSVVPTTPLFPIVLLAMYFALPVADWFIFRRLWRLPVSGFPVILGKRLGNELLVSYAGEVYFYLWAKRHAKISNAPFGAIKDVNILSALAGNLLALALLLLAYPWIQALDAGRHGDAALWSAGAMLGGSLLLLLLRRLVFSLPRRDLVVVFFIHVARILFGVVAAAALWHLAMPAVPIGIWVGLTLLRLLVGRLPLVPNKEILFVALAVLLIGQDEKMATLIAFTGAAMLLLHLIVGVIVAIWLAVVDRESRT